MTARPRLAVVDGTRDTGSSAAGRLALELGVRVTPDAAAWRLRLRRPHVVLYVIDFDDEAPGLAGLIGLAARHPVIAVSTSRLDDDIELVHACGARGHLDAGCTTEEAYRAAGSVASAGRAAPEAQAVVQGSPATRGRFLPFAGAAIGGLGAPTGGTLVSAAAAALWLRRRRSRGFENTLVEQVAAHTRRRVQARYSRLLHDHVLQTMEALAVWPDVADQRLRTHLAAEAAWLRRLVEEPDRLRPGSLAAGLDDVVRRFDALSLDVDLDLAPEVTADEVPATVVEALVGGVTAALGNVVRHAGVDTAVVTVQRSADGLEVRIADRGRGFGPAHRDAGFGLRHSIGGRMAGVGGGYEVASGPGTGTVVTLRCLMMPWEADGRRANAA